MFTNENQGRSKSKVDFWIILSFSSLSQSTRSYVPKSLSIDYYYPVGMLRGWLLAMRMPSTFCRMVGL